MRFRYLKCHATWQQWKHRGDYLKTTLSKCTLPWLERASLLKIITRSISVQKLGRVLWIAQSQELSSWNGLVRTRNGLKLYTESTGNFLDILHGMFLRKNELEEPWWKETKMLWKKILMKMLGIIIASQNLDNMLSNGFSQRVLRRMSDTFILFYFSIEQERSCSGISKYMKELCTQHIERNLPNCVSYRMTAHE